VSETVEIGRHPVAGNLQLLVCETDGVHTLQRRSAACRGGRIPSHVPCVTAPPRPCPVVTLDLRREYGRGRATLRSASSGNCAERHEHDQRQASWRLRGSWA
jgi:hypothetical protein